MLLVTLARVDSSAIHSPVVGSHDVGVVGAGSGSGQIEEGVPTGAAASDGESVGGSVLSGVDTPNGEGVEVDLGTEVKVGGRIGASSCFEALNALPEDPL